MKDLEFRLKDREGNAGTLEALGRQVHKIGFVDCASGHTGEVAVLNKGNVSSNQTWSKIPWV